MEEKVSSWLELAEKHGPFAIISVVAGIATFYLIKFILNHLILQIKNEREDAKENNAAHLKSIQDHSEVLKGISETNKEAHAHQRTEHHTMIGVLKEIESNQHNHKDKILEEIRDIHPHS